MRDRIDKWVDVLSIYILAVAVIYFGGHVLIYLFSN